MVGIIATAVALTRDGDRGARDDTASRPVTTAVSATGPVSTSCVEVYDLTALAHRETAFDGTVTAVDADRVTLSVNTWYTAGEDDHVTLRGASTRAGVTSAAGDVTLEPGTRLLVAGDSGFAWSCGFTQRYNAVVAHRWARAFDG